MTFPKFGGNPMPVMDASAITSGLAFLESELEKKDSMLREPLQSTTYPRDITIQSGGGWVEATSAFNVDYGVTGGSGSGAVGGVANAVRSIQANVGKDLFKVLPYEVTMNIKYVDVQRGMVTGRSIEKMYNDGIRLDFDKFMDSNVYIGNADYGTQGLVNQPGITPTSVKMNSSSKTEWVNKTPQEILDDINEAILAAWEASGYDESAIPNHILLPPAHYTRLVNTTLAVAGVASGGISLLNYLLENNLAKSKGVDLFIGECRWCIGAGAAGKNRMIAYRNEERFVGVDLPVELSRAMTQPDPNTASYVSLFVANVGQVKVHYVEPFVYRDGI